MVEINSELFRKIFSKRLIAFRMLAGYDTAREFAQELEVQEASYYKWEQGKNMPSIEQLVVICFVLGITPHELIWNKNKKSDPVRAITKTTSAEEQPRDT